MLYRKRFFTFRRYTRSTRQSTNSRLDTLLGQCGLDDRLLTGKEEISPCLDLAIDYDALHERIAEIRRFSWRYLREAFKEGTDTDLPCPAGRRQPVL